MNSNWHKNKLAAIFNNKDPSLTDQSQARDTDINVIVGKFNITGRVPGSDTQPMSGDFSELPRDLRSFIEQARQLTRLHSELPEKLRNLTTQQLLELPPAELKAILEPPASPPAPAPEPPK